MAGEEGQGSKTVKTRIPAHQKEKWEHHADEMGMSQSEFVRTMVQAGRTALEAERPERDSETSNPRGNAFKTRILDRLDPEPQSAEEIIDGITEETREQLRAALDSLHESGDIAQKRELYYLPSTGGDNGH